MRFVCLCLVRGGGGLGGVVLGVTWIGDANARGRG